MQDISTTIVVSSGTGTATLEKIFGQTIRIRVITPISVVTDLPSTTAKFDVVIRDRLGGEIFSRTDTVGTLSEECKISTSTAHTITIENASEDGDYRLAFDMGRDYK